MVEPNGAFVKMPNLACAYFQNGYEAVYLEHSFGRGLIPDSFSG